MFSSPPYSLVGIALNPRWELAPGKILLVNEDRPAQGWYVSYDVFVDVLMAIEKKYFDSPLNAVIAHCGSEGAVEIVSYYIKAKNKLKTDKQFDTCFTGMVLLWELRYGVKLSEV